MALSDILAPRLVELGKIKIGKKSDKPRTSAGGATWYAPEKIDHFLLTTLHRDLRGQLMLDTELMAQLVHDKYADPDGKIRRLPIRLLSNDPEDVMQSAFCWYSSRSIGARSDGKKVTWFQGHTPADWLKPLAEPITEDWKPEYGELRDGKDNKLFKSHTVFNCVIASRGSRFGGVHKFRTTSSITGSQLYGGLLHILGLTSGILMGLPLQLVVRPMPVNPEVNGKNVSSTAYVVHVELVGKDLQEIQDIAMKQAKWALQSASHVSTALHDYRNLLRSPGMEGAAEIADIAEEFHPEAFGERQPVATPRAIDEPMNGEPEESPAPTEEPEVVPPTPEAIANPPEPAPPAPPIDPPAPTKEEIAERELAALKQIESDKISALGSIQSLSELADAFNKLFSAASVACPAKHKKAIRDLYLEFAKHGSLYWDKTVKAFVPKSRKEEVPA